MNRLKMITAILMLGAALAACSSKAPAPESAPPDESSASTAGSGTGQPAVGEAIGTFTARGETVTLKYAYAGRGERFGQDSIIVFLTEEPVPNESFAPGMEFPDGIRGLEYAIDKDGVFWMMFHPFGFQLTSSALKEFSVDNGTVRGHDEGSDDLSNPDSPGSENRKYSRSVRFVASLPKQ